MACIDTPSGYAKLCKMPLTASRSQASWCSATGDNSKKVNWEILVEAITDGDGVALDATSSFDAANDDGGTAVEATAYHEIVTVHTLANKDSVQAGDLVRLLMRRDSDDVTNDTAASSAFLLEAELYEET